MAIYHYPLYVRLWHLINALLILLLIISGVSMQYSSPNSPLLRFDLSVQMHNICGIALSLNYLVFFIGNIITGNYKHYKIKLKGYIKELSDQFKHYIFGVFKQQPAPFPITEERKFNPLQKLTYFFVMYLFVPMIIISGIALFFPEIIVNQIFGIGGIFLTAVFHSAIGFLISIFLLIHVYFCTFGTKISSSFKSMISGWAENH